MIPIRTISTCLFYIYFYRYNYLRLGEHTMILWNLPDDGPSHSRPLLGPSVSMRGSTPGTNPHQWGPLRELLKGRGPMDDEHEEDDLDVLPVKPDGFPRHHCKVVVPHDVTLLHRSAWIETKNKGFNPNSASASNIASPDRLAKGKKNNGKSIVTSKMEVTAYEGHSVPGAPPAPHLSVTNVQAIGVGFCKMSAASVSGETLKASDNAGNKNPKLDAAKGS
jgi:hypothetical protein